jgi:serine/threonine-protein kinase
VPARTPWRKRLLLGALALAAAAAIVLVAVRPRHAGSAVASAPNPPAQTGAATTPPTAPAQVRCSLDSTPQDAEVIRVDSGALVGRTPLTVELPRSPNPVTFRFEKAGYHAAVHRVIPDLDKAVRVDLVIAPPATEPLTSAARAVHPQRERARTLGPHRKTSRASAPAGSANGSRDASKEVRSAIPVNPFDM